MIAVRDLVFGYGGGPAGDGFRLRVPELTIAAGEAVAFVGPSGCGKTTLVHLIAGILRPDAGEIMVGGRSLSGLGERELREHRIARIGLVFQQFELLDYLNARENILLPNFVGGGALPPARAKRDAVARLAASVGLSEGLLARRPAQLSQGERQRVAICRALLNEPEILIADEPTGNLDPDTTAAIMDVIWAQVRARPGRTFLMVTHDRSLLTPFDRVVDCRDLGGTGARPAAA